MSADNWRVCPKCEQQQDELEDQARQQLARLYNSRPLSEFLALAEKIALPVSPLKPTFREDYEIGVWKGQLHVDYKGFCEVCGYEILYEHHQEVP
jgi:hypothetical protein